MIALQLPKESNVIYSESNDVRWSLLTKKDNGIYQSIFESTKSELVLHSLEVLDDKIAFVTSNSSGKYQLHTMMSSGFHYQIRVETTDSIIPFKPGIYLRNSKDFSKLYALDYLKYEIHDFCLLKELVREIKKHNFDSIELTGMGVSEIKDIPDDFLFYIKLGKEETIWGTASLKPNTFFFINPFFYSEITNKVYSLGTINLLTPTNWAKNVFQLEWANQLNQVLDAMKQMEIEKAEEIEKGKQMLLSISK
ncbi:MAG: hypothetical protein E7168_05065 [Firmicutes bacterium]|nr:hypothetical protein [Bacillota bacterium]